MKKKKGKSKIIPKRYSKGGQINVSGAVIPQKIYDILYEMNPSFNVDCENISAIRKGEEVILGDGEEGVITLKENNEGRGVIYKQFGQEAYQYFDRKLKAHKLAEGGVVDEALNDNDDTFNLVEDGNAPKKEKEHEGENKEGILDEAEASLEAAGDKIEEEVIQPVEEKLEKIEEKIEDETGVSGAGILWFLGGVVTALILGSNK